MKKGKNIALWVVQVLLALLFVFSGVMKFLTPIEEMTKQMPWPAAFIYFIGVAEILGGLGLVLPMAFSVKRKLTPIAALCLLVIMIGAVVVSVMIGGVGMAILPFIAGVLCAVVAYGRW